MLINWAYKKYKAKKAAKEEEKRAAAEGAATASEGAVTPAADPSAGQDVQTTALQIEQPKE